MAQLHELPAAEQVAFDPGDAVGVPKVRRSRSITRYRITEWIWFPAKPGRMKLPKARDAGFHWVPTAKLDTITLSGPHRRWVNEFLKKKPEIA
jgi:A/G-specific adenine glycosylase